MVDHRVSNLAHELPAVARSDQLLADGEFGAVIIKSGGHKIRAVRHSAMNKRDHDEHLARDRRGVTIQRSDDEILARGNRYNVLTKRNDNEILARGNRFNAVTKRNEGEILARDGFGRLARHDDATQDIGNFLARFERI